MSNSGQRVPYLLQPIPIHTLVWLRVAVGLLAAFDILGNGIYYHWYLDELNAADFHFTYFGFEWAQPLPEPWLSLYFIAGFGLGLAVAAGWRFRYTAPALWLAIAYLFLMEKAHYLNHAYLFIWICGLLCFTPAWREWSLDVKRNPDNWSPVTPRWCLWIFPVMMGLVYFFGAIAKINSDWLLNAIPLRMWLDARADLPIIGPIISLDWVGYGMAWGGFLLDLLAPFLLLGRRSRWWILGFIFFFHLMNHFIFNIGIFPYLSLVLTSLYFAPAWPRQAVKWIGRRIPLVARWQANWRAFISREVGPPATAAIPNPHSPFVRTGEAISTTESISSPGTSRPALPFWQGEPRNIRPIHLSIGLLILIHCALPLRHHWFGPGVAWTEEGHRYSWRMMLRSKTGYGYFRLVDRESGESWQVYPEDELVSRQARKMYTHPDMILAYAHHLAETEAEKGKDVAVYAHISVRLNAGDFNEFIDPEVDLSQVRWSWFGHKDWITPFPN